MLWHWLAHSTGFRVEGPGCHGIVERVYGLPGATTSIAVRRAFRGRVLVPAESVVEVVPAEELLIVASTRSKAAPAEPRPPRRLARTAGSVVSRRGVAVGRSTARIGAASFRDLARLAIASGRGLSRLLVLAALASLRILRDAALSLEEVAEAARPVVRRLVRRARREVVTAVAGAREAAERSRSRRRREKLARSLEAMVAALGRDRSSGNGHVSPERTPERPRSKH